MQNKKLIFILLVIFIIIIVTIFLTLYYKNNKSGNNTINKSEEEIINNILEMKSYNAVLDITIKTNKNKTQYKVKQISEDNKATQEVIEPQNIAGVITKYDGKDLKIQNSKLNLEKTFQNYQYMVENRLWIDSFIEEYKAVEDKKVKHDKEEIVLEVQKKDTPYNVYKKLYISKKTGKPTKMIIKDINQKTLVYILYTEITIS